MNDSLPFIVVELVLVFGGVLAFAVWQLRDVAKARAERIAREQAQHDPSAVDGDRAGASPRQPENSAPEVRPGAPAPSTPGGGRDAS